MAKKPVTKKWKPNKKPAKPYGDVFARGGHGPHGRKQPSLPKLNLPDDDFADDNPNEEKRMPTYRAVPCPCNYHTCRNWLVEPVAAVQCVAFTQKQAEAVTKLLNDMEQAEERRK